MNLALLQVVRNTEQAFNWVNLSARRISQGPAKGFLKRRSLSLGAIFATNFLDEILLSYWPSISALSIEIDQDIAGLGAFACADDAAIFEFVHDPGSAAIAEPETALQE